MIKDEIIQGTLTVFKHCKIDSFPLDCWDIINQYGFKVKKYSELKPKKLEACLELSEDAATLEDTIYYNESKNPKRIRFSLMHELGHIILGTQSETDCDKFSSHLLAPRIAIHYAKCKNAQDVVNVFGLSDQAAQLAFDNYRSWHRAVVVYGMTDLDKELYNYFYDESVDKFVWNKQKCDFCYNDYSYNGNTLCNSCRRFELRKSIMPQKYGIDERNLDIARSYILYGNL